MPPSISQGRGVGRLSRRRYSFAGGRPGVPMKSGEARHDEGVILSGPGFAYETEEGETALRLDGAKVLSRERFRRLQIFR